MTAAAVVISSCLPGFFIAVVVFAVTRVHNCTPASGKLPPVQAKRNTICCAAGDKACTTARQTKRPRDSSTYKRRNSTAETDRCKKSKTPDDLERDDANEDDDDDAAFVGEEDDDLVGGEEEEEDVVVLAAFVKDADLAVLVGAMVKQKLYVKGYNKR